MLKVNDRIQISGVVVWLVRGEPVLRRTGQISRMSEVDSCQNGMG